MKKFALLISTLSLIWSCQDLNSVSPPDEYNLNNQYGKLITKTFNAQSATFKTEYRAATGNGWRLCTGSYKDFGTSFFIKFIGLPTDTTTIIDSAYVELTSLGTFGEADMPMTLQAYKVDFEWDEHTINTLPEGHDYQPTDLLDEVTVPVDSDTVKTKINILPEIIQEWTQNSTNNYGLYFKASGPTSNYIREFKSFETENALQWPKLYFYVNQGDTASVLDSTRIGFDATIFEYDSSAANTENIFNQSNTTYLLLSSGIPSRITVEFDSLSKIPANAVMQYANIEMDIDDTDILTGSGENQLFNGHMGTAAYIRSQYLEEGTLLTDSIFTTDTRYSNYLSKVDNMMSISGAYSQQLFGKYQIQDVVNDIRNTDKFYIHFADEISTLSVLKIFGLNDPAYSDTLKSIRLKVGYFEVTNDGF